MDIQTLISATLRLSTPLVFAALGGFLCERSGVVQIGLEGLLMAGAFVGAAVTLGTGSVLLGAAAACGVGIFLSLIYGVWVFWGKAAPIVAGVALNLLVAGLIPVASKALFGTTGSTPVLDAQVIWGIGWALPWTVAAWILVIGVQGATLKTVGGLWLRVAGEKPQALESAGISPRRVRWAAILLGGGITALGGAALSLGLSSAYSRNMTAGRGFMALAALIFGNWKPVPAALACLLFGVTDALQLRLQGVWGIPAQWIQALPYLVTLVILGTGMSRARAPQALGEPL